jgi:hypothetical protein
VIAEAVAAVTALGWALAAWMVLAAATATAAGYTLIAAVWWTVRGLRSAARAATALRTHVAGALADEEPASALVAQPDKEAA